MHDLMAVGDDPAACFFRFGYLENFTYGHNGVFCIMKGQSHNTGGVSLWKTSSNKGLQQHL